MARSDDTRRVVLRGSLGLVILALVSALSIFLLGDAVLRGAWNVLAVAAPACALVCWVLWVLLASPAVVASRDGVQLVGPLRRRFVSWNDIVAMYSRYLLTIERRDGRRMVAFGAPTAGVDRAVGTANLEVRHDRPPDQLLRAARDYLRGRDEVPRTTDTVSGWRVRELLIAIALIALIVVANLVV